TGTPEKCRPPPRDGQAPRTRHCLRMRMLSDLRPRERASEPSHNVLASTLLPRRRVCGSNFQDQSGEIVQVQWLTGAPEEIRTPDPQIRSLVLYPAELRARLAHRAGSVPEPSKSGGNGPLAIGFGRHWQGSA